MGHDTVWSEQWQREELLTWQWFTWQRPDWLDSDVLESKVTWTVGAIGTGWRCAALIPIGIGDLEP